MLYLAHGTLIPARKTESQARTAEQLHGFQILVSREA